MWGAASERTKRKFGHTNSGEAKNQITPTSSEVLRNSTPILYAQKDFLKSDGGRYDGQQTPTLDAFLMVVKVSDGRFFDTPHFCKVFSLRASYSLEGLSKPSFF